MNLTPKQIQAIRIAVAEVAGWNFVRLSTYNDKRPVYAHPTTEALTTELPNYPADLNAVHEVEMLLTGPQWNEYTRILDDIGRCGGKLPWQDINPSRVIDAYLVHANATDKCIALLMTLAHDKWLEIQNLKD